MYLESEPKHIIGLNCTNTTVRRRSSVLDFSDRQTPCPKPIGWNDHPNQLSTLARLQLNVNSLESPGEY